MIGTSPFTRFSQKLYLNFPIRRQRYSLEQIMVDPWFWNTMVADRVILFSGKARFVAIIQSPFGACYRRLIITPPLGHATMVTAGMRVPNLNRTAMLEVLQHHQENNKGSGGDVDVVKEMLDMNLKGLSSFRVASVDLTIQFGGASNLSLGDALTSAPLAISGTKANMMYKQRDSLLKHCPKVKNDFSIITRAFLFRCKPGQRYMPSNDLCNTGAATAWRC
jgi:hypothetical protein